MSTTATSPSLLNFVTATYNQGLINDCVPTAICEALTFEANEYHKKVPELSRVGLYSDLLIAQGTPNADLGLIVPSAYWEMTTVGIANESDVPNTGSSLFNATPTNIDKHYLTNWAYLNIHQEDIGLWNAIGKQLLRGKFVLMSTDVHTTLLHEQGPMDNITYDYASPVFGGHDVVVYGEKVINGHLMVEIHNSWGDSWGDHGNGYIPLNQLASGDLTDLTILDGMDGVDTTWTAARQIVVADYLVLGRTADQQGAYFYAYAVGNLIPNAAILDILINSTEGQALFGKETNAEFVNTLATNVLGRGMVGVEASTWSNQLNTESRGTLANDFINYYQFTDTSLDHDALLNRTLVSGCGAITYQDHGSNHAAQVVALIGVTSDANTVQPAEFALHLALYGI